MVDNEEFICWITQYGSNKGEFDEKEFTYNEADYAHLPSFLLSIDINKNGIPDYVELKERDFAEERKQKKLAEFDSARAQGLVDGVCPIKEYLDENLKSRFYSEYGADPIRDIDGIELAMIAMYYQRFNVGLEPDKVDAEFPEIPSFSFCSKGTKRAAFEIEDEIVKGINAVTGL